MLAHKARDESVMVDERLAGLKPTISYHLIPSVVYTWPDVAGVGYTEDQLKQQGIEYKVGKFPYMALGRARASIDTDGMVKLIADKNTDEIMGMHKVEAREEDKSDEGVVVMEYRTSRVDINKKIQMRFWECIWWEPVLQILLPKA